MTTNFNPLVSIIIPVYNGSNYMREAIDSALAQTYNNIEVIVVNDGSTDNTEEIAKSYGKKIRYYAKENGGVATALNLAIKKAKGEYVSWLSHDDVYLPEKIERQISFMQCLSEKQKTIIFSDLKILNQKTGSISLNNLDLVNYTGDASSYEFSMIDAFYSSKINGCTLLIPRKLFNEIGYFEKEFKTVQDYVLFMKFFAAGVKFKYLKEPLILSRHHDEQDSIILYGKHIDELNFLYRYAFDLFREKFQCMEFWKYEHFLSVIKDRGLDKVYAYMISEWANVKKNKNKPIIWLYWENKKEKRTPDYIRLCWKSIIFHNKADFQIKILTEDDVEKFLPNINPDYKLLKNIAHKADYIRFNLLYKYGGIWLDSDFICIRSLKEIQSKIEKSGFTLTSYLHSSGKYFPLIGFLGSEKNNKINAKMITKMDEMLSKKVKNGVNLEWDEFAGWVLSDIIEQKKDKFFRYSENYFCIYNIFSSENDVLENSMDDAIEVIQKRNISAFGQSVANSNRTNTFQTLSEVEILTSQTFLGEIFRLGNSFTGISFKRQIDVTSQNMEKVSGLNNNLPKSVDYSFKNKLRKKIRKFVWIISPVFRMQVGNRERMTTLISKVENNAKHLVEEIKKLNQSINHLNSSYELEKNNIDMNLSGEVSVLATPHKSMMKKYHCDNLAFFKEMKKYILKTDIVLDIGPGVRPQTFFTPKVHMCIEPFAQYRKIIKPLFPNRSHAIFLKGDGLESMKSLDDNSVDSVFMIDIIEHLEKEDGLQLLKEADRVARKQIIIFTPLGFYPMHFKEKDQKDAWGLDGNDFQEHKSGWLPEDFGDGWDFHICVDCHEAFLPEEKEKGKKYSALMAIKTKKFYGFDISENTPDFVKEVYKDRIIDNEHNCQK